MHDQYTHAQRGYLEWYSHLISPLDFSVGVDLNQDGRITAFELIEYRYNGFTLAAEDLIAATREFLQSQDHAERMAAIESLLLQIEGDLAAAEFLWEVMKIAETEKDADEQDLAVNRLLKRTPLRDVSDRLVYDLPGQLNVLASRYRPLSIPTDMGSNLENAQSQLAFEINQSIDLIAQQATQVSSRLAQYILKHGTTEWDNITSGIDILRGQQRTGSIAWGLEDRFQTGGLASELRSVLVNIITRILMIVEKNDLVRYTIADWLDDLKDLPVAEIAVKVDDLLDHLYQTETIQKHLGKWLQYNHSPETLIAASQQVKQLGDNFTRLALLIRHLSESTSAATLFREPLLQSAGYALQVGLLGLLVFAGYDHLDEGTVALNITQGIKEILVNQLSVPLEAILSPERY